MNIQQVIDNALKNPMPESAQLHDHLMNYHWHHDKATSLLNTYGGSPSDTILQARLWHRAQASSFYEAAKTLHNKMSGGNRNDTFVDHVNETGRLHRLKYPRGRL